LLIASIVTLYANLPVLLTVMICAYLIPTYFNKLKSNKMSEDATYAKYFSIIFTISIPILFVLLSLSSGLIQRIGVDEALLDNQNLAISSREDAYELVKPRINELIGNFNSVTYGVSRLFEDDGTTYMKLKFAYGSMPWNIEFITIDLNKGQIVTSGRKENQSH